MAPRGSVYYMSSRDRWASAIKIKGKKHVQYSQTKEEAHQKLDTLRKDLGLDSPEIEDHHPSSSSSVLTTGSWVDQWLRSVEHELRPSTYNTYRNTLGRLTAPLSPVPLVSLTPAMIQNPDDWGR